MKKKIIWALVGLILIASVVSLSITLKDDAASTHAQTKATEKGQTIDEYYQEITDAEYTKKLRSDLRNNISNKCYNNITVTQACIDAIATV